MNKNAARTVRIATTANGENPNKIDCFPKMGVNPRKTAELKAEIIPFVRAFIKIFYFTNALTSSKRSSLRKSPFCISDFI